MGKICVHSYMHGLRLLKSLFSFTILDIAIGFNFTLLEAFFTTSLLDGNYVEIV